MPWPIYLFIICVISVQWLVKPAINILQQSLVYKDDAVVYVIYFTLVTEKTD